MRSWGDKDGIRLGHPPGDFFRWLRAKPPVAFFANSRLN